MGTQGCSEDADCPNKFLGIDNSFEARGVCLNSACGVDLNPGLYYFRLDPSVQCYDDRHMSYIWGLFVPSLLGYCLAIPAVYFWNLRKYKKLIYAGGEHRVVWGFITSGFEIQEYFWELVVNCKVTRVVCVYTVCVFPLVTLRSDHTTYQFPASHTTYNTTQNDFPMHSSQMLAYFLRGLLL